MNEVYQFASDSLGIEWGRYRDPQLGCDVVSSRCMIDGAQHGWDEPVDMSIPEPHATSNAKKRCIDRLLKSKLELSKQKNQKESE